MVIGDFHSYSTLGQGAAYLQKHPGSSRLAVTLDAEPDPKTPYQYAVNTQSPVLPPPEPPTEVKYTTKRLKQNMDPVSQAFLAVANYEPTYHRIDVRA